VTGPVTTSDLAAGDWLGHIKREALRFVSVAARSPLPAHVPAYPDFTVETLAAHVGRVLRAFEPVLSASQESAVHEPAADIAAPAGSDVIEWVWSGIDPILELLRRTPPGRLVAFPHGAGSRPAALVAPLLAVEVGVHRWDLETVLGEHAEMPAELAVRAIDSVFESFVPRLAASGVDPIGGRVRLTASDAGAGWNIAVEDGRLAAGRLDDADYGHDVTVSGQAQDLALLIWKRRPPAGLPVQVTGRPDVLKRFLSVDYVPDPRCTPAH
jgi:uncharacterized protein (TIGR03083 family)